VAEAVGLGDGHGVLEALLTAVPLGVADAVAAGLGVVEAFGLAVVEGVAVADGAWKQIEGWGVSSVWPPGALAVGPPRSRSAAGTTSNPRMTVTTKASAPHSWSQKPPDELRIRARRPDPAGACSGY
jgi:hypothetical protein